MRYLVGLLLVLTLVSGCKDEETAAILPDPVELTEEAAGHYCQMIILEHEGPKAQAHFVAGMDPVWFSQVRDGLAYILSPEEEAEVIVMYVNDMGAAESWAVPGIGNWISIEDAFFVVGSDAIGGMGAPEPVPFLSRDKAAEFVSGHGGEIMRLEDIPVETVLAPIEYEAAELEVSQ
jgi:copper chaperone NosL